MASFIKNEAYALRVNHWEFSSHKNCAKSPTLPLLQGFKFYLQEEFYIQEEEKANIW